MKDFDHTVNVLVRAYLKETLQHQNCACCAVGNIISEACGYTVHSTGEEDFWVDQKLTVYDPRVWGKVFGTTVKKTFFGLRKIRETYFQFHKINSQTKIWADETGYSIPELARIERAFERAPMGKTSDQFMFNGLMAVVDVLAEIHGIDLEKREETKKLFVKA